MWNQIKVVSTPTSNGVPICSSHQRWYRNLIMCAVRLLYAVNGNRLVLLCRRRFCCCFFAAALNLKSYTKCAVYLVSHLSYKPHHISMNKRCDKWRSICCYCCGCRFSIFPLTVSRSLVSFRKKMITKSQTSKHASQTMASKRAFSMHFSWCWSFAEYYIILIGFFWLVFVTSLQKKCISQTKIVLTVNEVRYLVDKLNGPAWRNGWRPVVRIDDWLRWLSGHSLLYWWNAINIRKRTCQSPNHNSSKLIIALSMYEIGEKQSHFPGIVR